MGTYIVYFCLREGVQKSAVLKLLLFILGEKKKYYNRQDIINMTSTVEKDHQAKRYTDTKCTFGRGWRLTGLNQQKWLCLVVSRAQLEDWVW